MDNDRMDAEIAKEILALPEELRAVPHLTFEKGMEYCGDAEDYVEALHIYYRSVESVESKAGQIEQYLDMPELEAPDLKAYTITVHSLKSTSLAIGAVTIFELAKELEQAGKDGNIDRIRSDTKELLRLYRELQRGLKHAFEEVSE